jgi:hypothetical protein
MRKFFSTQRRFLVSNIFNDQKKGTKVNGYLNPITKTANYFEICNQIAPKNETDYNYFFSFLIITFLEKISNYPYNCIPNIIL